MLEQVPTRKEKSPDDIALSEFVLLVKNIGATGEQMRQAYYKLCGINEEEGDDEIVNNLYVEMDKMVKNKFPLNRFSKLIETKEAYEYSVEDYVSYVNGLPLSEKEKNVLSSIIIKQRNGKLIFFINNKEVAETNINIRGGDRNSVALILRNRLEELMGQLLREGSNKLEISFSED